MTDQAYVNPDTTISNFVGIAKETARQIHSGEFSQGLPQIYYLFNPWEGRFITKRPFHWLPSANVLATEVDKPYSALKQEILKQDGFLALKIRFIQKNWGLMGFFDPTILRPYKYVVSAKRTDAGAERHVVVDASNSMIHREFKTVISVNHDLPSILDELELSNIEAPAVKKVSASFWTIRNYISQQIIAELDRINAPLQKDQKEKELLQNNFGGQYNIQDPLKTE